MSITKWPRWADMPEFHNLPVDWSIRKLIDVVDIIAGQSPPSETYNEKGNGLPFLQGCTEFGDTHPVTRFWCSLPSKVAPAGSTLMSVRAPVGEINKADQDYAIGRGLAALLGKEIDPDYLTYGLNRWKQSIQRLGQGSTFEAITTRQLKKIIIALPRSINEQSRIVSFLKIVDMAIEKTTQEYRSIISLKKSLLRSMFCYGIKDDSTYSKNKWFTCPKHWKIKKIKNIAHILSGFTIGRDLYRHSTTNLSYVTVINVQDGFFDIEKIGSIEIKNSEMSKFILQYGDILMTEGGDRDKLGRGGMWKCEVNPCSFQNHIFRVRLNGEYKPELFHYFIQTYHVKRYFYAHAKQTSNLCTINSRELKNWYVPIPPLDEQDKMIEILQAFDAQAAVANEKVTALEILKKNLLQNLFTGKIRIPEGAIDV